MLALRGPPRRHARGLLVQGQLLPQVVRAQVVAVVRAEDDQGVLREAQPLEDQTLRGFKRAATKIKEVWNEIPHYILPRPGLVGEEASWDASAARGLLRGLVRDAGSAREMSQWVNFSACLFRIARRSPRLDFSSPRICGRVSALTVAPSLLDHARLEVERTASLAKNLRKAREEREQRARPRCISR